MTPYGLYVIKTSSNLTVSRMPAITNGISVLCFFVSIRLETPSLDAVSRTRQPLYYWIKIDQ
jgi:hypothetical protein